MVKVESGSLLSISGMHRGISDEHLMRVEAEDGGKLIQLGSRNCGIESLSEPWVCEAFTMNRHIDVVVTSVEGNIHLERRVVADALGVQALRVVSNRGVGG